MTSHILDDFVQENQNLEIALEQEKKRTQRLQKRLSKMHNQLLLADCSLDQTDLEIDQLSQQMQAMDDELCKADDQAQDNANQIADLRAANQALKEVILDLFEY